MNENLEKLVNYVEKESDAVVAKDKGQFSDEEIKKMLPEGEWECVKTEIVGGKRVRIMERRKKE